MLCQKFLCLFYFENISYFHISFVTLLTLVSLYDLKKQIVTIAEISYAPHHVSLFLISYINIFITINEEVLMHYLLSTKAHTYSDFYRFYSFPDPGKENTLTFTCNVSLGSF